MNITVSLVHVPSSSCCTATVNLAGLTENSLKTTLFFVTLTLVYLKCSSVYSPMAVIGDWCSAYVWNLTSNRSAY